jgi:hypothetical protein
MQDEPGAAFNAESTDVLQNNPRIKKPQTKTKAHNNEGN